MPTTLPAGWKLVPIEPTPEMIKAWHDAYSNAVIKTGRSGRAYAAMLAAAPIPPASAQDDAKDDIDVLNWLQIEISALDCRYLGDPSYDHDAYWMRDRVLKLIEDARKAFPAPAAGDARDAERWRFIRRKLCLTGNGDGTCGMHAINLPASIPGWPDPGAAVAEFCDAAIDAAIASQQGEGGNDA